VQTLQTPQDMPRKQRFKPSRKPKTDQSTVSNPQIDDRKEIHPDEAETQRESPDRDGMGETEQERR